MTDYDYIVIGFFMMILLLTMTCLLVNIIRRNIPTRKVEVIIEPLPVYEARPPSYVSVIIN